MKQCYLCNTNPIDAGSAVLFLGEAGDEKAVCTDCEQNVITLTESDQPLDIHDAINYLYTFTLKTPDQEVSKYIDELINEHKYLVEGLDISRLERDRDDRNRDYFLDSEYLTTVNSIKTLSWVIVIGVLIVGAVPGVLLLGISMTGAAIALGSIVLAVVAFLTIRILLDMEQGLVKIRQEISDLRTTLKPVPEPHPQPTEMPLTTT